jgi:hypothetical protein
MTKCKIVELGKVAVDSGQVIIVDPSYVAGSHVRDFYDEVSRLTMSKKGGGQFIAAGKGGADRLLTEEDRNTCGVGRPFQMVDAIGVVLGTFLMVDGIGRVKRREKSGWPTGEVVIATLMLGIHSQRFLKGDRKRQCADVWCEERGAQGSEGGNIIPKGML